MLSRLFIVVFILITLASPAMGCCGMMNHTDMTSMSHDMSNHDMSHDMTNHDMTDDTSHEMTNHDMSHDMSHPEFHSVMDNNHPCNSALCFSSCTTSFSFMDFDKTIVFSGEILRIQPKENLLSLYKIFLPINTPPPLV